MNLQPLFVAAIATIGLSSVSGNVSAWDIRGNFGTEFRQFPNEPLYNPFVQSNVSASAEVELFQTVGENGSITITPFVRVDQQDGERTHLDLRELLYTYASDSWELSAGLGKIFWGVAESNNIVDVINQKDQVEGNEKSNKLGQPLINLKLLQDWGTVDLFILPGFRERTFPGRDGRPRAPLLVDTSNTLYESDDKNRHIDFALRYSHAIDEWDFGLHAFHGTARDPLLQFNPANSTLSPFYYQSSQAGIDVQATLESWLLKAETIYKTGDAIEDHAELVTGFEYSFYSVAETDTDLGIVVEWMYDDRDDAQPFQNDLLLGLRLALNNESSSEALIGVIQDLDHGSQTFSFEASTRIGNNVKLSGDINIWHNVADDPQFGVFAEEDFLQLDLRYFF